MSTTSPTIEEEKWYLYLQHRLSIGNNEIRSTWEHVKYRLKNGIERWGTFISKNKILFSDSPYVILENIGEVDSYICNKNDTEGHLYGKSLYDIAFWDYYPDGTPRSNRRPLSSYKLNNISKYFKISSDKIEMSKYIQKDQKEQTEHIQQDQMKQTKISLNQYKRKINRKDRNFKMNHQQRTSY